MYRKRKSLADAQKSSQPTPEEEPVQAYGLGHHLDVPQAQLQMTLSMSDDVIQAPASAPASTCQAGRPTGKGKGMDEGSEHYVEGDTDQRNSEPPTKRRWRPGAHVIEDQAQVTEVSVTAEEHPVSADRSHVSGQPTTKIPAMKATSVRGYRFGRSKADDGTTSSTEDRKSCLAEPRLDYIGLKKQTIWAFQTTSQKQDRGRDQCGCQTNALPKTCPTQGWVHLFIFGDRRVQGMFDQVTELKQVSHDLVETRGWYSNSRNLPPPPYFFPARRSLRVRDIGASKSSETAEPLSTSRKALSTGNDTFAHQAQPQGGVITTSWKTTLWLYTHVAFCINLLGIIYPSYASPIHLILSPLCGIRLMMVWTRMKPVLCFH